MAKKYLIVVDVQNDFVWDALGTEQAQAIVPKLVEKIRTFDGGIIFTMDTHQENYLDTQEGKLLPVKHCIKGSRGWKLIDEMEQIRDEKQCQVFEKPSFGSIGLAEELAEKNKTENIEYIELVGLCTDICVVSNALMLKAYLPETAIGVDASCCAGVTPESHKSALDTMKSCQIIVSQS